MVKKKQIKVIIGANYGDEGKGRMTDYFARKELKEGNNTIVVCSNGGAQRGHTVVLDNGYQHIFHHFGSGTLAGADTYLPESFIVNPMIFIKEYNKIESFAPTVFINPNCLISTPFDMMNNQIIELSRGDRKHGSCGVGIWETIVRNGLRYEEMIKMSNQELFNYLKQVRDRYSRKRLLQHEIEVDDNWSKFYYDDNMIHNYIEDLRAMQILTSKAYNNILKKYDSIIFENGQGLLLDGSIETLYSTPSDTKFSSAFDIIKDVFPINDYELEVCYVTRSYLTRHALGDFREEWDIKDLNFIKPNFESNTNNPHQGNFRYGLIINTTLQEIAHRAAYDFHDTINDNITKSNIEDYNLKNTFHFSLAITHMDEYDLNTSLLDKLVIFDPKCIYKVYGPKSTDKVIVEDKQLPSNKYDAMKVIKDVSKTLAQAGAFPFNITDRDDGGVYIDFN